MAAGPGLAMLMRSQTSVGQPCPYSENISSEAGLWLTTVIEPRCTMVTRPPAAWRSWAMSLPLLLTPKTTAFWPRKPSAPVNSLECST